MATPQNPGEEGRVEEQDPNRRGAVMVLVDSSWLCRFMMEFMDWGREWW